MGKINSEKLAGSPSPTCYSEIKSEKKENN
jgi:hypothetical protein